MRGARDDSASIWLRFRRDAFAAPAHDVESREKATDQLLKIGLPAELALRKAEKETRSLEQRNRIGVVLRVLEGFVPQMSAPLHRIRAIQVLERIGSEEAHTVLRSLGTYDGQAALERLEGLHKQWVGPPLESAIDLKTLLPLDNLHRTGLTAPTAP